MIGAHPEFRCGPSPESVPAVYLLSRYCMLQGSAMRPATPLISEFLFVCITMRSRRRPPVNRQACAGDITGFGAGKVSDHRRDLVWGAITRQSHQLFQHLGKIALG